MWKSIAESLHQSKPGQLIQNLSLICACVGVFIFKWIVIIQGSQQSDLFLEPWVDAPYSNLYPVSVYASNDDK